MPSNNDKINDLKAREQDAIGKLDFNIITPDEVSKYIPIPYTYPNNDESNRDPKEKKVDLLNDENLENKHKNYYCSLGIMLKYCLSFLLGIAAIYAVMIMIMPKLKNITFAADNTNEINSLADKIDSNQLSRDKLPNLTGILKNLSPDYYNFSGRQNLR